MIITFIYKINSDNKMFYGKITDDISDDVEELDIYVKDTIYPILKKYNIVMKKKDIKVGIMSFTRKYYDNFSEDEKDIFDFLYIGYNKNLCYLDHK